MLDLNSAARDFGSDLDGEGTHREGHDRFHVRPGQGRASPSPESVTPETGTNVIHAPNFQNGRQNASEAGHTMGNIRNLPSCGPFAPTSRACLAVKRAFDIVASTVAIIFFAPLMAVLFFLIRRDGGPAIFAQDRVGRDGTLFRCYKFRSMVVDAEAKLEEILAENPDMRAEWARDRKLENDPRVTPIGHFIRRKSLDELPQLFNVLLGDLSIVGPRPIVPAERALYGDAIGHYESVRPGLTGAWQVSGRNLTTYDRRVRLDVDYVDSWSLKRDADIVLRTVHVVLSGKGAR